MNMKTSRRWAQVGALVALATFGAACSDSEDTNRTVTAADYSYQDLPKSVDAGATLTLKNSSTKELHEMVAFRIPDSERRSVQELVSLPEAEQEAIFGGGPPAFFLIAPPGGGEMIKALGDGTLTEKGRYAVACFIPTGADPAAYLQAAQSATDGPPQVDGGPPHVTKGMYGEITVK